MFSVSVTHVQKRRGWVWLAIIAMAVAAAPSAEAGPKGNRLYSPILNLLASQPDARHGSSAAAFLRTKAARWTAADLVSRDGDTRHSSLFRDMLAGEFVGLVSPLTPVSAVSELHRHRPPGPPAHSALFQRPPPHQL